MGGPGGHKGRRRKGFCYRFYAAWVRPAVRTCSSLFVAVLLWYGLGVVSIGTSKILLTTDASSHVGGVPPLYLTLQQLFLGAALLRFLAEIRLAGITPGVQAWPSASGGATEPRQGYGGRQRGGGGGGKSGLRSAIDAAREFHPSLVLAAAYFAMGFLATNYGFSGAPASFVETIKASEPITSAAIAVAWGIEVLSRQEVASLGAIVAGVLLSTVGNSVDDASGTAAAVHNIPSNFSSSFRACVVVMASNLCFSFRGLYQKLLRQTPEGSSHALDDLNLQLRMQQIGVAMLVVPVVFLEGPSILRNLWFLSTEHGLLGTGAWWRYAALALTNGFAFAGYNLASTYILSRISVVHHAALNCIRRIFAIIVTSMLFQVPITATGVCGIVFSFVGFMAFSHYKVQRQAQPKPLSSLLPISAAVDSGGCDDGVDDSDAGSRSR